MCICIILLKAGPPNCISFRVPQNLNLPLAEGSDYPELNLGLNRARNCSRRECRASPASELGAVLGESQPGEGGRIWSKEDFAGESSYDPQHPIGQGSQAACRPVGHCALMLRGQDGGYTELRKQCLGEREVDWPLSAAGLVVGNILLEVLFSAPDSGKGEAGWRPLQLQLECRPL